MLFNFVCVYSYFLITYLRRRTNIKSIYTLLGATVATKLRDSVYPIDVFLTSERDRKFGGKFADDRLH